MEDAKCLAELDEVLKFLNYDDLIKIPEEIRTAINKEKDKKYEWHYDETKSLSSQSLNRKTMAMLSYLNMEYLLNEEEKALMKELHEFNEEQKEKAKIQKYETNDIFKNKSINNIKSELMPNVIKKDKWYKKVFLFIKNILK